MKKAASISIYILFILTILYPTGSLIALCFGYTFELISVPVFAVIIAVLSVCAVVLDFTTKYVPGNKGIRILLSTIAPLSLVNAVFYIFAYPQIWMIVSVFFSSSCCCLLTSKHSEPVMRKLVTLVLSALMVLVIGLFSIIALIFGSFGKPRL